MKVTWNNLRKPVIRITAAGFALILACTFSFAPAAQALTESDLKAAIEGYPDYDPTEGEVGSCGIIGSPDLDTSDIERENAKAIIGVAKTFNLGQQGALIGIMTALVESHLQNYANSSIPESVENPDWLALPSPRPVGNDHDSVGIMQQRPKAGWSTYGIYTNGASDEVKRNIVWQLMDTAYAAQAFFGTPEGAKLPQGLENPGALRKGLQNLPQDWREMDPGEAAQAVQISAFPDRYSERQGDAQTLLDQLWNETLPVPLSIPVDGISEGGNDQCTEVSGSAQQRILQTIALYAWPQYRSPGSSNALVAKSEYALAIREAAARGEYIGAGLGATCGFEFGPNEVGADCGAFVTRVMRDSGVDPKYNEYEGPTGSQLDYLQEAAIQGKYIHIENAKKDSDTGADPLKPGDIAIRNGHTYFYVGNAMRTMVDGWEGATASASLCERTAMASNEVDREGFEWYRFAGSEPQQSSSINTQNTQNEHAAPHTSNTNAHANEWTRELHSYIITREDTYAA